MSSNSSPRIGVEQIVFLEKIPAHMLSDNNKISAEALALLTGQQANEMLALLQQDLNATHFFIQATVEKKIVGCLLATLQKGEDHKIACHMDGIIVKPEMRQQGVGRTLITALQRAAVRRGVSRIIAPTGSDYEGYKEFFDKYGIVLEDESVKG